MMSFLAMVSELCDVILSYGLRILGMEISDFE